MNMNNLAQTHEILTPQLATKVGLTKFEFYKYTSNISARRIRVSASGTDKFFSHLEIVCLTT